MLLAAKKNILLHKDASGNGIDWHLTRNETELPCNILHNYNNLC